MQSTAASLSLSICFQEKSLSKARGTVLYEAGELLVLMAWLKIKGQFVSDKKHVVSEISASTLVQFMMVSAL